MRDAVDRMLSDIKSLATPLQDLILARAALDRDFANKAAAELLRMIALQNALEEELEKLREPIMPDQFEKAEWDT